jgi:hypothetical protein
MKSFEGQVALVTGAGGGIVSVIGTSRSRAVIGDPYKG